MTPSKTKSNVGDALRWNVLVGRNLKAFREKAGLRQDDVARIAREWGLAWARSTVASIETGRRALELQEAVGLVPALGLRLADLFAGEEWVTYAPGSDARAPGSHVRARAVAAIVSGRQDEILPKADYFTAADLERALIGHARQQRANPAFYEPYRAWWPDASEDDIDAALAADVGEPELRAVKSLVEALAAEGRDSWLVPEDLSILAHRLWGQTLSEEREARLSGVSAPGAARSQLKAVRGHVTRQLLAELRAALDQVPRSAHEMVPLVDDLAPQRATNGTGPVRGPKTASKRRT